MSENLNYDIVVIGSGPGGTKAAVQGAKEGRRVAMIEQEREVGGACVYHGTIPSKTLREAALQVVSLKRGSSVFEVKMTEHAEISTLMLRLEEVLSAQRKFIQMHLGDNAIDHFHGRAKLVGPNAVQIYGVDGSQKVLHAEYIVIATGSRPRQPPDVPIDHEHILDSDSILSTIYVPRSLTVVGGGVIATEYASIFALLGTQVTMIDRAPRPLMFLDPELTEQYTAAFESYGGTYLGNQEITSMRWDGASQVVTELASGEVIESDKMLFALGRVANVEGLGLAAVGVEQGKRGHVLVDKNYRSNIPSIYAVGDVIGAPALASCSMEQGRRAVCHALGIDLGYPFEIVPIGIYGVPEMASVGLSEEQAREQYGSIVIGRADFREIARGQIVGVRGGMLKLIADGEGKRLLGAHIIGESACDLIHVAEMALINGNEVTVFTENIFNFPTFGEAYRVAALNLINKVKQKKRVRQSSIC